MAITESRPIFLKSIDGSGDIKDKKFITKHMRDAIVEVEPNNMVQIIKLNFVRTNKIILK